MFNSSILCQHLFLERQLYCSNKYVQEKCVFFFRINPFYADSLKLNLYVCTSRHNQFNLTGLIISYTLYRSRSIFLKWLLSLICVILSNFIYYILYIIFPSKTRLLKVAWQTKKQCYGNFYFYFLFLFLDWGRVYIWTTPTKVSPSPYTQVKHHKISQQMWLETERNYGKEDPINQF